MDIENMRAFITVAEHKSISLAAKELLQLQSNMTAKIKKIESEFNTELFYRKPRGMELNENGKKLYAQFKKIVLLWEETRSMMNEESLSLKLGLMVSKNPTNFDDTMKVLYEKYENLTVTIKTGSTPKIEEELVNGMIDIGFLVGKTDVKSLHYKKYGTEKLVLIGKNLDKPLEEILKNNNLIISSENCYYKKIFDLLLEDRQVIRSDFVQIAALESMINMCQLGMGVTLIPESDTAALGVRNYKVIDHRYCEIEKFICYRKNHTITGIEQQLMNMIVTAD
ncbi:LysR family transcriptional regulator [Paenibacillus sp. N3/727]|uniref:LysR family transcriptional regulator n=1 Tax=Paenibacillus sp. N3/727 TaxID=2925845 RepID=UPI001F5371D6|nr:LysR family transcriptional regulator [Paenibacillus sp. N3/727]UNK18807.1 LysR family transcriptional regulator [Paenibacillus sp. N3/727]